MLFNSFEFIFFFLPFTFLVYFFLLHRRLLIGSKSFLVFASLFFYSWWDIAYLPLILTSMLFNYAIGNSLNENFSKVQLHKKTLLVLGIFFNLGLLGFFKYMDFFIENFNALINADISLMHLALPLAISFFTFQQIAYLVDSYQGETNEYDFLNYALFVTFFPQLIAGPIVHHKEMMPQFASRWNMVMRYKNVAAGLFVFSLGLFKKVAIADSFAVWATQGFDHSATLNMLEAWATSLSYTFQLYFDFSGYTDMAIGAALLFNIRLPVNFNSPYKARNIQDFWRRWHITLSRFLRDYIYIPLGGSYHGNVRTYENLMMTFLLGGLWHGAGWTFVFWGFLHGMASVVFHFWKNLALPMNGIIAWFITFNFINISWVFFRAKEWDDAIKVLKGMVGISGLVLPPFFEKKLAFLREFGFEFGGYATHIKGDFYTFVWIFFGLFSVLALKNSNELQHSFKPTFYTLTLLLFIFLYSVSMLHNVSEFLYFNF